MRTGIENISVSSLKMRAGIENISVSRLKIRAGIEDRRGFRILVQIWRLALYSYSVQCPLLFFPVDTPVQLILNFRTVDT